MIEKDSPSEIVLDQGTKLVVRQVRDQAYDRDISKHRGFVELSLLRRQKSRVVNIWRVIQVYV